MLNGANGLPWNNMVNPYHELAQLGVPLIIWFGRS